MSPGQITETIAELPSDLRATITGGAAAQPLAQTAAVSGAPADDRVSRIEDRLDSLIEALRTLAHGLEDTRQTGADPDHIARAARFADQILIAAGTRTWRVS